MGTRDYSGIDPAIRSTDAEDVEFERRYGPWAPFSPTEAREVLAGLGAPWWVCGGLAIEAFTHVGRPHDDIDIAFFRRDLPALRATLGGRFDLWSVGAGALRPLTDTFPGLHDESEQVWVRQHAWSPWRADLLATVDREGLWVNKRDPSSAVPLDDVTWLADDGIRYLAPEVALMMKAKLDRPKDQLDLAAALPLLDQGARARLRSFLEKQEPSHHWLTLV